jgi:hypothetical protein
MTAAPLTCAICGAMKLNLSSTCPRPARTGVREQCLAHARIDTLSGKHHVQGLPQRRQFGEAIFPVTVADPAKARSRFMTVMLGTCRSTRSRGLEPAGR